MALSRFWRAPLAATLTCVIAGGLAGAAPARAASGKSDWAAAQASVGRTLQLWRPTYTAGLPLQKPNGVRSEICRANGRSAMAYATYSRGSKPWNPSRPSFIITEMVADNHCADGGFDWVGDVAKVRTRYGRVTISASCGWDRAANQPVQNWNGRCRKSDVLTTGGAVVQWKPRHTGRAAAADVSISSDGLTYQQLVKLVRGLRPVG